MYYIMIVSNQTIHKSGSSNTHKQLLFALCNNFKIKRKLKHENSLINTVI